MLYDHDLGINNTTKVPHEKFEIYHNRLCNNSYKLRLPQSD